MRRKRLRHRSKSNSRPWENLSLRNDYREANHSCEIGKHLKSVLKCAKTSECHHIFGNFGQRWDLVSNLIMVCRPCHEWCHANPVDGRMLCLLVKWCKSELHKEEFFTVTGKHLVGWLDINDSSHYADQRLDMIEFFRNNT